MIFSVEFSIQCKPGFFSSNKFDFAFDLYAKSWQSVEDTVFQFVNDFPWNKLHFQSYSEPDIRLIKDNPSDSDIVKVNADLQRTFVPTARRMHTKNGTANSNDGGGTGISGPVKLAAIGYAGYKFGKSNWIG